jgi:hypothetical protein
MNSETLRRRSMSRRCAWAWKYSRPSWPVIAKFKDERAYAWGGMWIHPCGISYQEPLKDEFEEGWGEERCSCALCSEFRQEFCS